MQTWVPYPPRSSNGALQATIDVYATSDGNEVRLESEAVKIGTPDKLTSEAPSEHNTAPNPTKNLPGADVGAPGTTGRVSGPTTGPAPGGRQKPGPPKGEVGHLPSKPNGPRSKNSAKQRSSSDDNWLKGSRKSDRIEGKAGNDTIYGLGSSDTLDGGTGNDFVSGSGGRDVLYGGDGDDNIDSRNMPAAKDAVRCGAGNDTVWADRADVLDGCENVYLLKRR